MGLVLVVTKKLATVFASKTVLFILVFWDFLLNKENLLVWSLCLVSNTLFSCQVYNFTFFKPVVESTKKAVLSLNIPTPFRSFRTPEETMNGYRRAKFLIIPFSFNC